MTEARLAATETDCVSERSKTGIVNLGARLCEVVKVHECGGFVCNLKDHEIQINEATLAVTLTNEFYNKCVLNAQWGHLIDGQMKVSLLPVQDPNEPVPPENPVPPPPPDAVVIMSSFEVTGMLNGTEVLTW